MLTAAADLVVFEPLAFLIHYGAAWLSPDLGDMFGTFRGLRTV